MGVIRKTKLAITILCLSLILNSSSSSSTTTSAQGARVVQATKHFHSRQLSVARTVVRATLENASLEGSPNGNNATEKLSAGAVTGIVVGSVFGGVILVVIVGVLIRWLCQRSRSSSGTNQESKPGNKSATKVQRVQPPVFGSDRHDPDDISDTSFVLPELGGPNPHNKFDGMEWVDIKGMNDEVLVEISSDLRKYSTGRADC